MELFKRPRSNFWMVDLGYINGVRHRRATKQTKKSAAMEVGTEMLRQLRAGLEAPRTMLTLEQFADQVFKPFLDNCSLSHNGKRCYRNGVRLLKGTLYISTPLDQVCYSDVDTLQIPGGPSNVNNMRRTLRRMLSMAVEKKYIKAAPRIRLRKERQRKAVYAPPMEQEMLSLAEQPLQTLP